MKIRTLEEIQLKIVKAHNRRSNVFYDKVRRLMDLRREEFNAIDFLLQKENPEFRQLAADSIQRLSNLQWKMDVTTVRWYDDSDSPSIAGMRGYLDENGVLRCRAYKAYLSKNLREPVSMEGSIDHLGTLFMKVTASEDPNAYRAPVLFRGFSREQGKIVFSKEPSTILLNYPQEITVMMGKMLKGKETDLRQFVYNKDRLMQLINSRRIKLK